MNVLIGVAGRRGVYPGNEDALKHPGVKHKYVVTYAEQWPFNYNLLWARGLNVMRLGITHMMYIATDIVPRTENWADALMDVLLETGVDVVSVCTPYRDATGILMSGAGMVPHEARFYLAIRRLTVHEALQLPSPTFDLGDLWGGRYKGHPHLLNNSLMVADLTRPIFHLRGLDGALTVHHGFESRVCDHGDGIWCCEHFCDDWGWSRLLHEAGGTAKETMAVKVDHMDGTKAYPNWQDYGTFKADEDTRFLWDEAAKMQTIDRR